MEEKASDFLLNWDHMYRTDTVFNSPEYRGLQIAYLVISLVLAVGCGLLLIFLVLKKEYLRKPRHYLRCNLAVADIIFTGVLIPTEISLILGQDSSSTERSCLVQMLVGPTATVLMFGTYLLMAVELYCSICHPLHYNTKVTTKRVIICIAAVMVFALCFGMGPAIIRRLQSSDGSLTCDSESFSSTTIASIFKTVALVGTALAVLAIFIIYYLVFKEARKQQERDENRNLWLNQTKAFKVMAPHVVVLAVSVGTYTFMISVFRGPLNTQEKVPASLFKTAQAAKLIFLTLSSMVNPVVYSFRLPEFRRALRETAAFRSRVLGQGGSGQETVAAVPTPCPRQGKRIPKSNRPVVLTVPAEIHHNSPPPLPGYIGLHDVAPPKQHNRETSTSTSDVRKDDEFVIICGENVIVKKLRAKTIWQESTV